MITKIDTKKNSKSIHSPIPSFLQDPRNRIIIGLVFILFSIYLLFALGGFFFTGGIDQSLMDQNSREFITRSDILASNPAGKVGAYLADLLINRSFGVASFIFCYLLWLCGLQIAGRPIQRFTHRLLANLMLVLWFSLLLGYIFNFIPTGYVFPGGAHGHVVSLWLNGFVGNIGTFFIILITFAGILFFGFESTYTRCVEWLKHYAENRAIRKAEKARKKEEQKSKKAGPTPPETPTPPVEEPTNPSENPEDGEGGEKEGGEPAHPGTVTPPIEEPPLSPENTGENEEKEGEGIPTPPGDGEEEGGGTDMPITVITPPEEEEIPENLPLNEDYDPTLDLSRYTYPPLELLEDHSSGNPKVTQDELEANKNKIVETLRYYKIEITKIQATIGPTVTLYEIVPAPGVKISRIKGLEDDIALSLAALGIRIIAPIPGAGTIGIEVPNQNPEIVSMRGIIASKKFQESKYALPVALGRTISNEPYTFDLTKMPHLLVAGATGQGKSVGLNAIITSLLYKKHPSQLKFVMVDPKKVELSIYSVIEKHFLAKLPEEEKSIITDTDKVINTLNSLCIEMDNRYDLLQVAQARNIKEYNEKFIKRQLNPEKGHRYLPYIVVIVDEFADLIMTAGKEVEHPIARIAQLARAVGIHMIIATQRPSTNIITGVIKANFPARIAFKVASMIDSRTILDASGANQLIGRGDLLISVNSEMVRVQCALVDTPEVEAITQYIARQQGYPFAYALPDYTPEGENGERSGTENLGERDSLFEEAARLVVNTQQGSTSSIQRRFSIGYNRAGRIMDQLEAAGIVGPYMGSKTRDVLIQDEYSLEQLLRTLN